jgi:predicted dehydrogenase
MDESDYLVAPRERSRGQASDAKSKKTMRVNTGPLRVGLVGAGAISSAHAASLKMIAEANLVALCDAIPGRAQEIGRKFGVTDVYSSADEMLREARLDAAHILTPPQYHVDVALRCLRAGTHVLVEKPLALSVADCALLQAESARTGLVCGVNHSMTYVPIVERILEEIRSCRLGRIEHLTMDFCAPQQDLPVSNPNSFLLQSPTNVIFEFGPHPFSVVRLIMGKLIRAECFVTSEKKIASGKRFFDAWHIAMECERGTAALHLLVGRTVRNCSLRVFGEDGVIHSELGLGTFHLIENNPYEYVGPLRNAFIDSKMAVAAAMTGIRQQVGITIGRPNRLTTFFRSQSAFYQAVLAGASPREDVNAGRDVIEYCEQALTNVKFAPASRGAFANGAN